MSPPVESLQDMQLSTRDLAWRDARLERIRKWESCCTYRPFIDEKAVHTTLQKNRQPPRGRVLEIIARARENTSTGEMLPAEDVAAHETRSGQAHAEFG